MSATEIGMSVAPSQNPGNANTILDRFHDFLRVHFINCADKIAGFLVTIIGLLTSLWADCILVVTCMQDYDRYASKELYIEKTIIHISQLSHLLIVVTGTIGFLYGIKVKNKAYFTPWIFIKIIELGVLFLGIIFLATGGNRQYVGVIPFGVCFFLIGLYITLCVWNTYKHVDMDPQNNMEEILVNSNSQLWDPPPSYDNYTLQSIGIGRGGQYVPSPVVS